MTEFNNTTEFQDNYNAYNRWSSTLSQDLTSTGTVVYLTGGVSNLPDKGWISIDYEVIFYSAKNNSLNTLTVGERGAGSNSIAAAHSSGAAVQQRVSANVINWLMMAIKKYKAYNLQLSNVAADTISEQNIAGFASRVNAHEMRIIPSSGSTDFVIELYKQDTFLGVDKVYETINMSCVQTTLDGSVSGATVPVTSTTGFLVGELGIIGDLQSSGEIFYIDDIDSGVSLEASDALSGAWTAGETVTLIYTDRNFHYKDLDWTGELHIRVINYDASNPVTIDLQILAEVSDEA